MSRWARGGFHVCRSIATDVEQLTLVDAVHEILDAAPALVPVMPTGTSFKCSMSGAGDSVFFSSKQRGYHYAKTHPTTGASWPPIPELLLELAARTLAQLGLPSVDYDSLLVIVYELGQSLGRHVDLHARDYDAPIWNCTLGAGREIEIGGLEPDDPFDRVQVWSGDSVVMSGSSRLWHHGAKRVLPVMLSCLPEHGRSICLSLRKAE